jgi:hypothetical protein
MKCEDKTLYQYFMKRIFISVFLAAFATYVAKAESVTKSEAYSTAQQYMFAKGKIISQSKTPFRSVRKANGQPESAYYYVFNADGGNGYVIVSGDDRTPEILGYVDSGSFDPNNIPENMKSWLQLYEDQIKFLVDNNITVNKKAVRARSKAQTTHRSVPEILTTRWNQGQPYNITCPDYYLEDDTKEPTPLPRRSGPATGCTATAMAQVMNFYRYPSETKNVIPGYTLTYTSKTNGSQARVTQAAIPRGTRIDWDNMQDRYSWGSGHVANAQDSAVANLMHMCGQAVNMHYGPSSGANFSAEAYIKYFGFDNSCYVGERGDYSIDDWFDMIYNEISQGYPVLFSGFSSGGGHAFVLDGFDGDNLFHVNWGWGGGSNGWFLVSILNPGDNSGIGASSSSDGYSMGQRALFNLRLPDDDKYDTYLTIKDVTTTGSAIRATFENRTGATGSFSTGIVRIAEDGTYALVGAAQSALSLPNNSSTSKTFQIKGKLPEGTYQLSPASKANKSTEWRPKFNMRSQYVEAVVAADGSVTLTPYNISAGSSISIDTITFPGTRAVGKEQEVKVTFRNNGNEYYKEIHMFASQTTQKIYTDCRSIVAVRKDDKVDVSYFFTPEETGTYNLWFCTSSSGSGEVGRGTIEIVANAQAETANLTVNSYTISNAVSNVIYGHNLVGKATIRNNDTKPYVGYINLQLWNQPTGSSTAWGGSNHNYEVNIQPNKTAVIDFSFEDLSENNKYYIAASLVNHQGTFKNSGVWDLGGWEAKAGLDQWKNDGSLTGRAWANAISTATNICGVYGDLNKKITRLTPSTRNPNVIYAFSSQMQIPERLDTSNVVSGAHSDKIRIVSGYPYFVPTNFKADTATFVYTFPADLETEVAWKTVTMPFDVDSIVRGEFTYQLNDTLNHFWIYEFAQTDDDGNPVFKPATALHGGTPYIIACDKMFKGKTIEFKGYNKTFYKSGLGNTLIGSNTYSQYAYTFQPSLKNVYALNDSGTAFEYITTSKSLPAIGSYFTTKLADEERLEQILLPAVPVSRSKSAGWGDVNQDQQIDASDVQALALVLVLKAPEGAGVEYGDVNGDGKITIADLVTLINQVKE